MDGDPDVSARRASASALLLGALVLINIACRSSATCANGIWHSAYPKLDNCHADYAQRNARELANLLKG